MAEGAFLPDHILQRDTTRSFVFGFMRQRNLNTEFVRAYLDEYGEDVRTEWSDNFEGFVNEFNWSDAFIQSIRNRMEENGLVLTDTVDVNDPVLEGDQLYVNPLSFEQDRWILEGSLKAELSRQIWGYAALFSGFQHHF